MHRRRFPLASKDWSQAVVASGASRKGSPTALLRDDRLAAGMASTLPDA